MRSVTQDPLLTATRWLVNFMLALSIITGAAILLAMIGVIAEHQAIFDAIAKAGGSADWGFIWLACAALALVLVVIGVLLYFLIMLRRIIVSVGDGDPFAPVNATRLAHMGWAAVAGLLLMGPLQILAQRIVEVAARLEGFDLNIEADLSISLTDLMLPLVLFVLARVFKRGAEMRRDLEGTV